MKTENMTRRELYMVANRLFPEEVAGATDLECELDIRGITGDGCYGIKGYCSRQTVERCSVCDLCRSGQDCHGNKVA